MTDFDAIVLCAGLGTRLRPLTAHTAKPAVPLFGRPLVGYAFALLRNAGFGRVVINTHWQPEAMTRAAHDEAARESLTLGLSHEGVILGTGGVHRRARTLGLVRPDADLVVLNGDVLFDLDLSRIMAHHRQTGADATMVLREMPAGAGYSPIETGPEGRVLRIGKYGAPSGVTPRLFTGVHILSPRALERLPEGECGVIETVYAPLLAEGGHVASVMESGLWLDLGDPAGYLDAHLTLMSPGTRLGPLAESGVLRAPVDGVSAEAVVDPAARLVRSAVGAGARVGADVHLEECVVLPGASVGAGERLRRTIVTPDTRIAA